MLISPVNMCTQLDSYRHPHAINKTKAAHTHTHADRPRSDDVVRARERPINGQRLSAILSEEMVITGSRRARWRQLVQEHTGRLGCCKRTEEAAENWRFKKGGEVGRRERARRGLAWWGRNSILIDPETEAIILLGWARLGAAGHQPTMKGPSDAGEENTHEYAQWHAEQQWRVQGGTEIILPHRKCFFKQMWQNVDFPISKMAYLIQHIYGMWYLCKFSWIDTILYHQLVAQNQIIWHVIFENNHKK